MKQIKTVDAVGHVICHDITKIVVGGMKGVAFKKGHIVREEDIPELLSIGKEHLYVWECDDSMLHENDAAKVMVSLCKNEHMTETDVREGKIELIADTDGLYVIDVDRLDQINEIDELMIASIHTNTPVKKGDRLLGTRVIPLVIKKDKLEQAKQVVQETKIAKILPYQKKTVAVITTGSEVYHGRIEDTFTPVLIKKLEQYGVKVTHHKIVNDEKTMIIDAIHEMKSCGVDLILCTGGMSVDPDDLTPGAVKEAGADIVSYGAPVLPGAMFLLGYFEHDLPILGLPGCVMYTKATIFDLILPRILAGVKVTKKEIAKMGHGGLCTGCKPCTYPHCHFGKGV